jgi:putative nucleotidyltransferase with HDIG domain
MTTADREQILIVDDHAGVCETLSMMVEQLGHQPLVVHSGEEAVEMIALGGLGLVLTDLRLPDMDGIEVLRRSREMRPETPVILLTGYPTVDQAVQAIRLGACEFLTKPFKLEILERVITRALEECRLVHENHRLAAKANRLTVIQRLNAKLNRRVRELTSLNRISEEITEAEDNTTLFECVVELAVDLTAAQRVSLMLVTPDGQSLTIRTAHGLSEQLRHQIEVPLGEGIAGSVAQSLAPLHVTRGSALPTSPSRLQIYHSPSFISVPLAISGEVLGVLNLSEKHGGEDFSTEEFHLILSLAAKAAMKVENNALYESLHLNLVDTLRSLVGTLEAKDPYTKEHSKRVTQVAMMIGREMGLSETDIESIEFAAILHDVGKIGVRDSILLKVGRLTTAEFEVIKTHPVIGESIVEPLNLIQAERDIIRSHHERVDGTGYPDGLRGDEIPLLARIVAVADAYDAMTTTRPYRRAMGQAYALSEFERTRGLHYDPDVIDALHRTLRAEADDCLAAM